MQVSDIELLERLRADTAGAAVLYRSTAGSLPEPLRLRFGRFELSPKIEDLANKHGVAVWFRR